MPQDPTIDQDLPGLCGCNHDMAYHTRPVFGRREDGSMALMHQEGCTTCLCPKFGTRQTFTGVGANAPKLWPGGGKE